MSYVGSQTLPTLTKEIKSCLDFTINGTLMGIGIDSNCTQPTQTETGLSDCKLPIKHWESYANIVN